LLDRKKNTLNTLEQVKSCYLQLVLLKHHERDAFDTDDFEYLYELSENERVLVEDINSLMKYVVPDLLYLRDDRSIRYIMSEIDELHESVIEGNIEMRSGLKMHMQETLTRLRQIDTYTDYSTRSIPRVINIRA
jgi:hypothetical protein